MFVCVCVHFKIGFNAVFLMPIRLTCILILFIIVLIISIIVTLGISTDKLNNQPFSGWRNNLRKSIVYLSYAIYFCAGFHRIKVKGKRATKAEARVFVLGRIVIHYIFIVPYFV